MLTRSPGRPRSCALCFSVVVYNTRRKNELFTLMELTPTPSVVQRRVKTVDQRSHREPTNGAETMPAVSSLEDCIAVGCREKRSCFCWVSKLSAAAGSRKAPENGSYNKNKRKKRWRTRTRTSHDIYTQKKKKRTVLVQAWYRIVLGCT